MPAYNFIFIADHGRIGAEQTALAAAIVADAPDLLISGGDGVYAAANETSGGVADATSMAAAWAAFSGVTCPIVPCIGNHERDGQTNAEGYMSHFSAETGDEHYYRYYHTASRTGIYVLDSGYDTGGVQRQADGVGTLSVQGDWLENQIINNAGDEDVRIIVQHHPPVGMASVSSRIRAATDFNPAHLGATFLLTGHTHSNWALRRANVYHVCCGQTTTYSQDKPKYLYGNTKDAYLLHKDQAGVSQYSQPSFYKITRDGNMTYGRFLRVSDQHVVGPKFVILASPK